MSRALQVAAGALALTLLAACSGGDDSGQAETLIEQIQLAEAMETPNRTPTDAPTEGVAQGAPDVSRRTAGTRSLTP